MKNASPDLRKRINWSSRLFAVYLCISIATLLPEANAAVNGVLRIHPTNPRYFTDNSGKAILLGGHQSVWDLQDHPWSEQTGINGTASLDWNWYMTSSNSFMVTRKFNYLRNWILLNYGNGPDASDPTKYTTLMPYLRTGQTNALDGRPKFDLTQFNQAFFDRLHARLLDAQNKGIYVSIMLFDVYDFMNWDGQSVDPHTSWFGNVFYGPNNINNVNPDGPQASGGRCGLNFFYNPDTTLTGLQQAYVRKVIDTVNDLDNVIYEIANELDAPAFQAGMVTYIRNYEAGKPKQHLILRSPGGPAVDGSWTNTPKATVVGGADLFSLDWNWANYNQTLPNASVPVNNDGKPGIWDNDHMGWMSSDYTWPWRAFTRGYHFSIYERSFDHYMYAPNVYPPVTDNVADATWERLRYNTGQVVTYAGNMGDLAAMSPQNSLSTTNYCLASAGNEYIVFRPATSGSFNVSGLTANQVYYFEWYDTYTQIVSSSGTVTPTSSTWSFSPSFANPAVLYLRKQTSSQAPYPGPNPASIPGTVQAENFDSGGQNISYYDNDSANVGGQYRTSEMVDLATCTDTGGGYSVGWNPAGEWVEYTVSVGSGGSYNLSFRVACVGTGNTFRMEVDNVDATGTLSCPDTGGWQTWQNTTPVSINLTAGTHVLKFVSVAGTGFGLNYFTLTAGLPSPWLSQDTGTVSAAGSASYSGGTFTVAGSGADIWGTGDEFQYVYQPVSGDCTIVARVVSQSYAHDWAKSGVMVREGLAAGATNAFMFKIPLNNQIVAQHRTTTGGTTAQPSVTSGAATYWVKLNRTGNTFTFFKSTDGSNWGSALATQSITMSSTVNVGLAVTSHADGTLCTTTFDNVTVTGGSGYTSVKDWNFNTDGNQEGWTLTRCTATVSGGAFNLTATATDPLVKSPSSLGITTPGTYNKIRIRMKNNSPQTSAAASFITTADQNWGTNGKWVQFTITANSNYTDYVLDMSTVPSWTGTIHQIRIDPLDPAVSGQTVNIDYVRISN